ncbi:MAG TPA: hypothetical protein VGL63_01725 [Streptosporangiaceae bacterium]|jgi:hypothetical protein
MTYSVRPVCYLVLLPLIVTALTAAFLGYAAWRLTDLAWLLACLACHRLFPRELRPAGARRADR